MTSADFRRCIVSIPHDDHRLTGLTGIELPAGQVTYRLGRQLGTGATATAFLATRQSAEGELSVVVKVTLPAVLNAAGPSAALAIRKEAVSLGRLSSVASLNPFVIRLLDVGELDLEGGGARSPLPWIALEYVHGGAEGTTLGARVERTISETGHGFDLRRIERLVRGLSHGLAAIHDLRVIHRDVSPEHVLCCGRGDDEVFKLAEFGFARALGMKETFGRVKLGRPGYAAPEQTGEEGAKVGPWSDVYALAATTYFAMTGREYAKSIDPLAQFRGARSNRARLRDCPALHPEFAARPEACDAIDRVLADAMATEIEKRPPTAEILAGRLLGAIQLGPRVFSSPRLPRAGRPHAPPSSERFVWSVVSRPRGDLAVRSVAWSGDGRALAATDRGLAFWDSTRWIDAPRDPRSPKTVRWVRAMGTSRWLLSSDRPMLQRFDGTNVTDYLEIPADPVLGPLRADHASGDVEDLAVFVLTPERGTTPMLCALTGGRWLAPMALVGVDVVTSIARASDRSWLVAGRASDGSGWLGLYEPLSFRLDRLPTVAPTFLAAAGEPERGVGLACGLGGSVAWFDGTQIVPTFPLREPVPLAAAAFDSDRRVWVASTGAIYCAGHPGETWRKVWSDTRFHAPFGSIYADDGRVLAMTVDGGVVEGRID